MKIGSQCSPQDNLAYSLDSYKKNKSKFFTPNQEHINNFKSAKIHKKTQSLSINALLFALAIVVSFFIYHEALIFVAMIGIILIVASAKTHLNSKQYHSLSDSQNFTGEHQCVFCGNEEIYRSTPHKTNITQCRCSQCKQHLFND